MTFIGSDAGQQLSGEKARYPTIAPHVLYFSRDSYYTRIDHTQVILHFASLVNKSAASPAPETVSSGDT